MKKYNCLNKDLQSVLNKKKKAILENDFKLASNYKITENKLLDEINNLELSLCNKKVKKKVNDIDVAHVIYSKTKIPVYEILNDNNRVINNILDDLKSNIVGQDKVIDGLINVAKRIKMGFVKDNKCYSMMFAGPSGVGKTYLATLFGKNMASKVIRLDMSEYSEAHSVSKIVGAPPGYVGYSDNNYILEDIKKNPYSVLILDEIERAHPSIINLFLQIFDNGRIKDSKGEYVRFDNVIIILTSNIGFNDINIGFNKCESKVISRLNETFGIPFVNRIDNIFVFDELNSDCINKLINKKILDIKKRYLENVDFKVNKKVYDEILSACNYKEYGARRIDKIIREKIENQIIDKVINKENKIYIEQLQ